MLLAQSVCSAPATWANGQIRPKTHNDWAANCFAPQIVYPDDESTPSYNLDARSITPRARLTTKSSVSKFSFQCISIAQFSNQCHENFLGRLAQGALPTAVR